MDLSLLIVIVCAVIAVVFIALFLVFGRSEAAYTFDIGGGAPRASGGRDESAETTYSSRLVGFAAVIGAIFAALLARLWSMQLVSSDEYTMKPSPTARGPSPPLPHAAGYSTATAPRSCRTARA